jgi:hypothetical protein
MDSNSQDYIFQLLGTAFKKNVSMRVDANRLIIENAAVNDNRAIVEELRRNEMQIVRHLTTQFKDTATARQLTNRSDAIYIDGKFYYEISKLHHHYWWVDNSVDLEFKKKVFILRAYRLNGNVDVQAIKQTLLYMLERHEILRTGFAALDGRVYLYVNDSSDAKYAIHYETQHSPIAKDAVLAKKFMAFEDHSYDLFEGPFLLVRLLQEAENTFTLSIKIHHCVFDGWSLGILHNEFLQVYAKLVNNEVPPLQPLEFFYKDYMHLDYCYRVKNGEAHRQYWRTLYPSLPPMLTIPGERPHGKIEKRIAGSKEYIWDAQCKQSLEQIAREQKVSLFIILQSLFNKLAVTYLGTQQLVVGTMLFNRDNFIGLEHQVGPYARTYLIGTQNDSDDFVDIVRVVKKANMDMKRYGAFALLDVLAEMLPPGESIQGSFWKINLYYQDPGFGVRPTENAFSIPGVSGERLEIQRSEVLLNINIEIRFVNHSDRIELAVLYDKNLYTDTVIDDLIERLTSITKSVCKTHEVLAN